MAHTKQPQQPNESPPIAPRRSFLAKFVAIIVGGVVTLIPAAAGAVFFVNPLIRKKNSPTDAAADDGFRKVGLTKVLQAGGPPVFFPIIGTKIDVWTTYPAASLGAVYVQLLKDGRLICYNARCTHLGCMVKFLPSQSRFLCPCHGSAFDLQGNRSNEIPPRDLDKLPAEIRNDGEIWVRFQNFSGGRAQQIPV
jgi:Rieske Fe-S protein